MSQMLLIPVEKSELLLMNYSTSTVPVSIVGSLADGSDSEDNDWSAQCDDDTMVSPAIFSSISSLSFRCTVSM